VCPRGTRCAPNYQWRRRGKFTIETDEEEEDLQDLIITEEEDEGMEEDTQPTHSATKLPAYVPP
jgi:hypothetical protein